MYKTINDFTAEWKTEAAHTLTILKALTDESLNKQTGYKRTCAEIAWHITQSASEMPKSAGLEIQTVIEENVIPSTASDIVKVYETVSLEVLNAVQSSWKDENLSEEINMYGEMWSKSFVLECLVKHQIHHRGQLTVVMRLAGCKVPGIYGPSEEEWAQMMSGN